MNFSINGRQPKSVIKRADEIKFFYQDKDAIFDLIEDFSDKRIVLDLPEDAEDWKMWKMYSTTFADFFIALHNLNKANKFNEENIKWYWPFPITSYYELDAVIKLNPSFIMIGPPLSFDLENVSRKVKGIPLRMTVNVAQPTYLPAIGDGVCGQWVRPEDAAAYEKYIDTFEFDEVNLSQEETLLKIYKENKNWPGRLNLIIKRLNFNIDNRIIPDEFAQARMTCGQTCFKTGICKLCDSNFRFAEQLKRIKAKREQKQNIDNN